MCKSTCLILTASAQGILRRFEWPVSPCKIVRSQQQPSSHLPFCTCATSTALGKVSCKWAKMPKGMECWKANSVGLPHRAVELGRGFLVSCKTWVCSVPEVSVVLGMALPELPEMHRGGRGQSYSLSWWNGTNVWPLNRGWLLGSFQALQWQLDSNSCQASCKAVEAEE